MFYLQIRRAELRDPNNDLYKEKPGGDPTSPSKFASSSPSDPQKPPMPTVTEITKIVSMEWKQLDDSKRKHFAIPANIQKLLREGNKMSDLNSLRDAVLQNVKENKKVEEDKKRKEEVDGEGVEDEDEEE